MHNLLTANMPKDRELITLDCLIDLFNSEKGWERRTDSVAQSVGEFIYIRPCEFNPKFQLQVWTGVPVMTSRIMNRPFRIMGFTYINKVFKPRTESFDVQHHAGWEVRLNAQCQYVISLMRNQQLRAENHRNERFRVSATGYVTTEFGQQVRY